MRENEITVCRLEKSNYLNNLIKKEINNKKDFINLNQQ